MFVDMIQSVHTCWKKEVWVSELHSGVKYLNEQPDYFEIHYLEDEDGGVGGDSADIATSDLQCGQWIMDRLE